MNSPTNWGAARLPLDLLTGIFYAAHFDKRGWSQPASRVAKDCRRIMRRIISSSGYATPRGNIETLDPFARKQEESRRAMADLIGAFCATCPMLKRGECKGVDRENVARMADRYGIGS